MNYLIFTPDGVGSTILQRLITMTLYIENQNVMNTHELTNGIELNNGIASKNFDLGYSQTLVEIANILQNSQTQTSLVSRLAKYHLDYRKDPTKDCQDFYKLLNNHFEKKIMCVRENIFEYAMSWSIRDRSGVLNVYGEQDRDKVSQVSEVDEKYFIEKCNEYVQYINWMEEHFPDVEKISYENVVMDTDEIIHKITGYKNTYLDNQVHIAHNVKIGSNCMIAGQVGFAGSSKIGDNVSIGGQAGISGHLKIGNNVKIGGGSGVVKDIKDNQIVMGYPAVSIKEFLKKNK